MEDVSKIAPLPQGYLIPRSMTFVPPKGSIHSMWQQVATNSSDVFMRFVCSSQGDYIVLLEADVTLPTGQFSTTSPGAFTGASTGVQYRYSLDNTTSGNVLHSLVNSIF